MPVQESCEGQQSRPAADFLVGEADLDGLFCGFEFNEFGHCLVTGFSGMIGCFGLHPSIISRQ